MDVFVWACALAPFEQTLVQLPFSIYHKYK